MLHIIEAHDRAKYAKTIRDMHVLRAKVFKDRLRWDVKVTDGLEVDNFDSADPVYLVSLNDQTGHLEGSVRLLPTTGPNMLRDTFSVLLPEGLVVESPTIWESSRFCIDPDLSEQGPARINRVTTSLLCGLVELGLYAGLEFIVSVYDARMARIFRASNCPAETIGKPTRIGSVLTFAGLFEISEQMRERIAAGSTLPNPLLATPSWPDAFAA